MAAEVKSGSQSQSWGNLKVIYGVIYSVMVEGEKEREGEKGRDNDLF